MSPRLCVFRPHLSPSLKAHHVLLLSRVCLFCHPPPSQSCNYNSSSDGKCFSIPCSPSPPHRISIFLLLTPSKLHLSYYRDVFIECTPHTPLPHRLFFCHLPVLSFHLFTFSLLCITGYPSFPSISLLLLSAKPLLRLSGLILRFCSKKMRTEYEP